MTGLLLDTHLLLWAATGSRRLPDRVHDLVVDPAREVLFSAASIWEVAIKRSLGRDDFDVDPQRLAEGLRDHGWLELAVSARHAAAVADLPAVHRDPFDRLLVAQAQIERCVLITHDPAVARYPGPIELV